MKKFTNAVVKTGAAFGVKFSAGACNREDPLLGKSNARNRLPYFCAKTVKVPVASSMSAGLCARRCAPNRATSIPRVRNGANAVRRAVLVDAGKSIQIFIGDRLEFKFWSVFYSVKALHTLKNRENP